MKRIMSILTTLTLLLMMTAGAQDGPPPDQFGKGRKGERLQHFKKLRMIEELKLGEEDAARFVARQRAHEEVIRNFMTTRSELIARLDSTLDLKPEASEISRICDRITEIDRKIGQQRELFFEEQRKALTQEQFARFLVFEWKFGRQVRDVMGETFRKRHRPAPDGMED